MLLERLARELNAELIEEQYNHVLENHEFSLSIKGAEQYGGSKFDPEQHDRLKVTVTPRMTPLGNQKCSSESITVSAKRPATALAKDIERRIVPQAKEFEVTFAEVYEKEAMTKGEWEQLIDHVKANDPADYVTEGRDRLRFAFQVKGSWRYFTVELDRTYMRYTVELDAPKLTPFAQLADKGDEKYRILHLKGHICYKIEYRSLPNSHYVYTLFDMFLEAFGFKKVKVA